MPQSLAMVTDARELGRSYQPSRLWAAIVSIAWNLLWLGLLLFSPFAQRLANLSPVLFSAGFFALYAILNFPVDLCFGYIHERAFGLLRQGVRAWAWDWLRGTIHHGVLFVFGCTAMILIQRAWPTLWLPVFAGVLLVLFLFTTAFAANFLPPGLFDRNRPGQAELERIAAALAPTSVDPANLPPIILFTTPDLRDFRGGLLGLGSRQVFFISTATLDLASEALLRFIFLHELGHQRYHHLLLSTLAAWAHVVIGLAGCDWLIRHLAIPVGSVLYIPWLALFFTSWMVAGHPMLAYLGRRLEYQADRFYLDHGGSPDAMQAALQELSARNLARTDITRRRESLFESLPTPPRRLRAARKYVGEL